MVRRKKYRRRKKKFTLPLAPIVGLGVGTVEPIAKLIAGDTGGAMNDLARNYIGWDFNQKNFNFVRMQNGVLPLVIGGLVHKFVGGAPLNINRMLSQANVPIIRL